MDRVLVVGGGLAAAVVESACTRRGFKAVVRAGQAPSASRVAAGMFNPVSFQRVLPVWRAAEHLAALEQVYGAFEARLGRAFVHQVPVLKVFASAEYARVWAERIEQQHAVAEWIAPMAWRDVPEGVRAQHGAGWVPGAGWVDVAQLLDDWSERVREEGRWEEGAWGHADGVPSGFAAVVDCRGVGAREDLAAYGLDLRPNHGEVLTVAGSELPQEVCVNAVSWLLPIGEGRGRLGSTYRWDVQDCRIHADTASMLVERVGDVLEATRRVLVERHVAGVRPTSPDRRPWVGEVQPGIWVCNGLGTRGVLVAPWTAERLLDAMTGQDAELPEEIDVRRFRTFKAN